MSPQPGTAVVPDGRTAAFPIAVHDPRTRILDAGAALFYAHGVQQVGMDQLCTAAGVSLKRFYREFSSKEQLIEACLRRRSRQWLELARTAPGAGGADAGQIAAMFGWLGDWVTQPGFRGCPFTNAVGELGDGSPGVRLIAREHKAAWRGLLAERAATVVGPRRPDAAAALADRLYLLAEGLLTACAVTPEPALAATARDSATTLVAEYQATERQRTRPRQARPLRRISRFLRRIRRSEE